MKDRDTESDSDNDSDSDSPGRLRKTNEEDYVEAEVEKAETFAQSLKRAHRYAELGQNQKLLSLYKYDKAVVSARDKRGYTLLHSASDAGKLETVKFLLEEALSDVNARDKFGATPLLRATWSGHLEVVRYLVEGAPERFRPQKVHQPTYWRSTPLHYACDYGHEAVAIYLLEHGADPLVLNDEGDTAFDVAGDGKRTFQVGS